MSITWSNYQKHEFLTLFLIGISILPDMLQIRNISLWFRYSPSFYYIEVTCILFLVFQTFLTSWPSSAKGRQLSHSTEPSTSTTWQNYCGNGHEPNAICKQHELTRWHTSPPVSKASNNPVLPTVMSTPTSRRPSTSMVSVTVGQIRQCW